jgi:hypothetical protein
MPKKISLARLLVSLPLIALGCTEDAVSTNDVPVVDTMVAPDVVPDRPTPTEDTAPADVASGDVPTDASTDTATDVAVDIPVTDAAEDVSCAEGQTRCGGSCSDLQTDIAHCGTCARACNGDQVCVAGTCVCPAGQTACGGVCVDTTSDRTNCGTCGTACGDRQICTMGACACAPDLTSCAGTCVDPQTSAVHCGACNRSCATNTGTSANECSAGVCVPVCVMGFADCDGNPLNGCEVDMRTSVTHCGACGNTCPTSASTPTSACVAGACVPTCAAGFANCDGDPDNGCETDTRTNGTHCGMCNRACTGMTACTAGACVSTCPMGATLCASSCVPLQTDSRNCGTCGRTCSVPNGLAACASGACSATTVASCNAGFGSCDGNTANGCETSTNTTAAHCGRCGNACAGGQACLAGRCIACGTPGADCPPALTAALVQTNTRVLLRFSELLAVGSANPAYFSITPALAITGASFGPSRDLVYLDTAGQANNTTYTVTVRRTDTNADTYIDGRDDLVKDSANNPIDTVARVATFVGMSAEIYAITDVIVTDNIRAASSAYTGLSSGTACTDPYVPGQTGTRVTASDVNIGIGGTTTGIFVRYARVRRDATTPVLTGMSAERWAGWTVSCPPGYTRANGNSSGRQGALTTDTDGACYRIGLCVRYEPMNTASTVITNVALSVSTDKSAPCTSFCRSNDASWSMTNSGIDIHGGCGDSRFVRLCTNRASPQWPPMPARVTATDAEKANLLATYAPRILVARDERYNASSVEYAFPNLTRYRASDGRYWVRTRSSLSSPSDTLPFFAGDQASAPIYAYWADKSFTVSGAATQGVDMIYYAYYPYNRGKEVLMTVYGNHVSDWEHVSVRATPQYDFTRGWSLGPDLTYVAAHDFGARLRWGDSPRTGTHLTVFSAWGSHGMWTTGGSHTYQTIASSVDLIDECSNGSNWDTWNRLYSMDYFRQTGLSGAPWPRWMNSDQMAAGTGDPANPASGGIYRWGNTEEGCIPGVCRLENGPTGPVNKGVWGTNPLQ